MSTARHKRQVARPSLVDGDHLDQPEFHRRYEAMPPGVKAELIDGAVYMPSPLSLGHSSGQLPALMWLGYYAARTPGTEATDSVTTILGRRSETQPDGSLRIRPEFGGQTTDERDYIQGAPELILEVAKTTRYIDLGPKLSVYEGAGVQEYLVRVIGPDDLFWFRRIEGSLARVTPQPDGSYRSVTFPGLWLDPQALIKGNVLSLFRNVDDGVATPEHAAFVAQLAARREEPRAGLAD